MLYFFYNRKKNKKQKKNTWRILETNPPSQSRIAPKSPGFSPIPVSLMPVTLPWSVHSHLFFMKTSTGFQDGHIWYSIFSSSAWSNFTRVQRVSCCFSLLLCTMLTSIMFWGVPKEPAEQKMDLGNSHSPGMEIRATGSRHELSLPRNAMQFQRPQDYSEVQ